MKTSDAKLGRVALSGRTPFLRTPHIDVPGGVGALGFGLQVIGEARVVQPGLSSAGNPDDA
eukprot:5373423-Pyramimonas_sp.AAC.1